jgi:hypothetical protein
MIKNAFKRWDQDILDVVFFVQLKGLLAEMRTERP